MENIEKLIATLMSGLTPREKDVLTKRFGLKGKDFKTLAELGALYGITRERVRQIESSGLSALRLKVKGGAAGEFYSYLVGHLTNVGGVRRADFLTNDLAQALKCNLREEQLHFLLEAHGAIRYHPEDDSYFAFWHVDAKTWKTAAAFIEKFRKYIGGRKEDLLTHNKFDVLFAQAIEPHALKDFVGVNYLTVSKQFGTNIYGDFGLTEWPEISPKTMRDRAYLVLKKHTKPLHFRELARLINEIRFDHKVAHPSTVHNELIKDDRFVLVGRGMYGLLEHGFMPGTAKDVIKRVLKANGPLRAEAVLEAVQKERFFKPNTVLLNLQNKKLFRRTSDGGYTVREA
ncbi:MAG: sigma factor-like helix-turn-helix DNA-binding protein [bacterium]|nr:sigma factor-like helix-turn-helix DNA-binding protein [bacterium]